MKIFYINLDARKDRKKFIEKQLDKLRFSYKRISAIRKNSREALAQPNDMKLLPNEISISLSHLKCWNEALKQNLKKVIILEDDALLSKNFKKVIKKIQDSDIDFDLIRIEVREKNNLLFGEPKWKTSKPIQYKLCRCYSRVTGLAGYIISSDFIKKIINSELLFSKPIDLALFEHDSIFFNQYKIFHLKPGLVIQLDQINNKNYIQIQKSNNPKKTNIQISENKKLFFKISKFKIINELLRPFYQFSNFISNLNDIFKILIFNRRLSKNLVYKAFTPIIKIRNRTSLQAESKITKEQNFFH
jgi:GR25 family glycosyltransferase involved in LPS biosynthesis